MTKSTVPVGTADKVKAEVAQRWRSAAPQSNSTWCRIRNS